MTQVDTEMRAMHLERDLAGGVMELVSVDVNGDLLARARGLVACRTDRQIVETALRRLIASKQQNEMVDQIAGLDFTPEGLRGPSVTGPEEQPER